MILAQANDVRRSWAEHQQRLHIEGQRAGAATVVAGGSAATPAAGPAFMAQLQQLGEMKSAGLLTDDEFAAANAKLLAT